MIERLGSKVEVRAAVSEARREGRRIGFVPTMGALHEGHLSLVRTAAQRTDFVVVSVFVNPTQFGEGEDFDSYPRDVDADLKLLAVEGVALAFTPSTLEMYGPDPEVSVEPGPIASRWEGEVRPGHFAGVATVVTKLLNIVRPDLAFFGEKDFQQLRVIAKVASDLDLAVGVVGCPTSRATDGLALSSRNAYLSAAERRTARAIPLALAAAEEAAAWGETDAGAIEGLMRAKVAEHAGDAMQLDYAAVVDRMTLEPLKRIDSEARALIAGRVGATRLIDNCALIVPARQDGEQ